MDELNNSPEIREMDKKYVNEIESPEFSALLDQEMSSQNNSREITVGEHISGVIREISNSVAFVDYGGRSEASIDIQELKDETGELLKTTGDTIQAYVASTEGEVRLTLSLSSFSDQILQQAFEKNIPVQGRVTGFNSGGLVVNLGGIRAFCPLSQVEKGYCEDPASYASKTLTFQVIEFRGRNRNIVLSRRAQMETETIREAKELRSKLSKGSILLGIITRLEPFGAFVDLGGLEGLIHISEISHTRLEHPRDFLSSGSEVQVKVLDIKDLGGKKERLSLSLRALEPNPWDQVLERFHEGDVINGKIVSIQKFGAFVQIIPGIEGLIHVSQLSVHQRVSHPKDVVAIGQEIQARIQSIEPTQKRVSLSIKALQAEAQQTAKTQDFEHFKANQRKQEKKEESSIAEAFRRAGLV